jgi:hypothetical protein
MTPEKPKENGEAARTDFGEPWYITNVRGSGGRFPFTRSEGVTWTKTRSTPA